MDLFGKVSTIIRKFQHVLKVREELDKRLNSQLISLFTFTLLLLDAGVLEYIIKITRRVLCALRTINSQRKFGYFKNKDSLSCHNTKRNLSCNAAGHKLGDIVSRKSN